MFLEAARSVVSICVYGLHDRYGSSTDKHPGLHSVDRLVKCLRLSFSCRADSTIFQERLSCFSSNLYCTLRITYVSEKLENYVKKLHPKHHISFILEIDRVSLKKFAIMYHVFTYNKLTSLKIISGIRYILINSLLFSLIYIIIKLITNIIIRLIIKLLQMFAISFVGAFLFAIAGIMFLLNAYTQLGVQIATMILCLLAATIFFIDITLVLA